MALRDLGRLEKIEALLHEFPEKYRIRSPFRDAINTLMPRPLPFLKQLECLTIESYSP